MKESTHRGKPPRQPVRFLVTILLAVLLFTTIKAENIKYYSRVFKVSPDSATFSLSIPFGAIKVNAWEKPEIKVNGTLLENSLEVNDRRTGDGGEINVHCSKVDPANFEIDVPQACTLDLKCLNGSNDISSAEGRILTQTTEGEISLNESHSANITAR